MTTGDVDSTKLLADYEKINAERQKLTAMFLDEVSSAKDKHVALRGSMGESLGGNAIPSYSVMHSMQWISYPQNIAMGSEMPFMETAIDKETGKLIIDQESAEELKQRAPDWTRQPALTVYLLQQKYRKFGSILAVVCPDWVDDPDHENWGDDGRALKNSANFRALDTAGNLGILDLEGARVYALDGQHRVMGIRGVSNVLEEGGLNIYKKEGAATGKKLNRDDFLKHLNLTITDLQGVLREKINVEYIPAVMAGESREEASRRIRSVFVAINKYAKTPDKGENILLDESDGYAIVARRLGIGHQEMFKDLNGNSRVNWKNKSIGPKDQMHITTLQHLRECCEAYGTAFEYKWNNPIFKDTAPIRPSDDELSKLEKGVNSIFEELKGLRCFKDLNSGDPLEKLREFPSEDHPNRRGHVLMRPIGLPIVMDSIAPILKEDWDSLPKIIEKLKKLDIQGGFEAHRPDTIWYGVTYNPFKKTMDASTGKQKLAAELLRYLLKGGESDEREPLIKRFVDARKVEDNFWIDLGGKRKAIDMSEIDLPPPIMLS